MPLVEAADDVGETRDPVPQRAGYRRAARPLADRCGGEQLGDVVAAELAVGQPQQREQRPARDRLAQRGRPRPVHRDAGAGEVLVQQPRVRDRVAVRDRHAVQRLPGLESAQQFADDDAHFVVGVGAAEESIAGGDRRPRRAAARRRARAVNRVASSWIGASAVASPVHASTRGGRARVREREHEVEPARRERRRREEDDGAEVVEADPARRHHRGRGAQLVLVGVGAGNQLADPPRHRDDRGFARPGRPRAG